MSRTLPLRKSIRFTDDRAVLHQTLDEAHVAHIALVVDGEPRVLPMFHVRVGERVYVHASTGGRFGLEARDRELRLCLSVTIVDGLVLAKNQFNHSANYRSVIAHGAARVVTDPVERDVAFAAFMDKVAPGRAADSRPANPKELAQTALLALDLDEATVKARAGGPVNEPEDADLPYWSGVVPIVTTRLAPVSETGEEPPGYLAATPWHHAATMTGDRLRLEALHAGHAEDLFEAGADPEVWSWLSTPQPRSAEEMAEIIDAAVADQDRVAWAQIDTATGRAIGTTSYYQVDPRNRSVAIGYTWLGKPWWRRGFNTESKLLMLRRAFDDLGALKVTWHTDNRNNRSQQAIERLGAKLEGVIRHHRVRPDGTLRDTYWYGMTADEWPEARTRLEG
ncbi:bifunctional pyridoxamine 5'-phosphate oxidase family protein/GNAT family N-acetyltransferase [Longispora sp. K20-0274]|uniref:bifunctional pyridoxamine 5'-phosphate oxidase family protein/GNAT family N-acetyltransferase n=1 Tax=Longispora sp. K20-0274 TaxID=3088255 RepID=UPI00399B159E